MQVPLPAPLAGGALAAVELGYWGAKAIVIHQGPTGLLTVVGTARVRWRAGADGITQWPPEEQLVAASEALQLALEEGAALAARTLEPHVLLCLIPCEHVRLVAGEAISEGARPQDQARDELRRLVLAALRCALGAVAADGANEQEPQRLLGVIDVCFYAAGQGRLSAPVYLHGMPLRCRAWVALAAESLLARLRAWARSAGARCVHFLPGWSWIFRVARELAPGLLLDCGAGALRAYVLRDSSEGLCKVERRAGGAYFARWLMLAYGLSPASAERVALHYATGQLPERLSRRVRRVFTKALNAACDRLVEGLREYAPLPGRVWLTGGCRELPEMQQLVDKLARRAPHLWERWPQAERLPLESLCRRVLPGPAHLDPAFEGLTLSVDDWAWKADSAEHALVGRRDLAHLGKRFGLEVEP